MKYQKLTLPKGERLTEKQIKDYVQNHDISGFIENERYYTGNNPAIMDRPRADANAPDNKVPISYARKIISTVVGYMYSPGYIAFNAKDEAYQKRLNEIFTRNRADLTTTRLGRQVSTHGVGFEIHYTDPESKMPAFDMVDVREMIPLYDYSLRPRLVAAIRHYTVGKSEIVDVYYPDVIQHFTLTGSTLAERDPEERHFYGRVPVVCYSNNEERTGDFDPVKPLINAYDTLMSDALNEFDRFSMAYLVLKGLSLDEGEDGETIQALKEKRLFEVAEGGAVDFLTKDIPSDFVQFMAGWIRSEIHKQSHVPDFLDGKTGDRLSGVAVSKLLYDFEFIAAVKEANFKIGLYERLDLLNAILRKAESLSSDVEIVMNRNLPQDDTENAEIMAAYQDKGISQETLIDRYAPFVKDTKAEIKKYMDEVKQGLHPEADAFMRDDSTIRDALELDKQTA